MKDVRIRCPKCNWEPRPWSIWQCTCKTVWNTFDTAGKCPGCGKVWKNTKCPSCQKWSPHLDWYEGLNEVVSQLKQEIEKEWSVPVKH